MGRRLCTFLTPSSCSAPRAEHLQPGPTVAHPLPPLPPRLLPPPHPRRLERPDSLSCPPRSPSWCPWPHPNWRRRCFHPCPHCQPSPSPSAPFLWSHRRPLARWAPPPPCQNPSDPGVQRSAPSETETRTACNSWAVPITRDSAWFAFLARRTKHRFI